MLVDAEHEVAPGEFLLEAHEPRLAEVAEPGVVVAALGVVVVGDDGGVDADRAEEVEAALPPWFLAHLVDLVDRHRVRAEGERGGRGERDDASVAQLALEDPAERSVRPLAERVGGRARAGEHVPGVAHVAQAALHRDGVDAVTVQAQQAGDRDVYVHALPEVGDRTLGEVAGVLLEPVRSVDDGGPDRAPETRDE